jgi:hypothetical protein
MLLYVLHQTIKRCLKCNFNKCDNIVGTVDFHNSNAMTEKFYMLLVTRSNLGVLERSFCPIFVSKVAQIMLRTSNIAPLLYQRRFLDAFLVTMRATPATYFAYSAGIHLAENTECLVNRL